MAEKTDKKPTSFAEYVLTCVVAFILLAGTPGLLIFGIFFDHPLMKAHMESNERLIVALDSLIVSRRQNTQALIRYTQAVKVNTSAIATYQTFETAWIERYEKAAHRVSYGLPSIALDAPPSDVHYIRPKEVKSWK